MRYKKTIKCRISHVDFAFDIVVRYTHRPADGITRFVLNVFLEGIETHNVVTYLLLIYVRSFSRLRNPVFSAI